LILELDEIDSGEMAKQPKDLGLGIVEWYDVGVMVRWELFCVFAITGIQE